MGFFTYIGLIIIIYYLFYLVMFFIVDCDITLAAAELFGKKLCKIRGKVVWITEVGNEIGEAMAYEIAENNGKIVLSALYSEKLKDIKEKCLKLNPSLKSQDVMILPMDVTKTATHKSCFNSVIQHFGLLDVLIGVGGKSERGIWEDVDLLSDRSLFKSNVFGVISLSRIAVQYFANRGKGQIVILSSLGGVVGVPYASSYAASLHAIHGYFESLRNEKLGAPLQITLLCPGAIDPKMPYFSFIKNEKSLEEEGRRMSLKRFSRLALVAVVNKLDEAWMAPPPIIPLIYAVTNFPNVARIMNIFDPTRRHELF